jgi:replication factor A1
LLIADKEGIFRVVLWNDKTNMIESGEVKTGQIIRFSHGYTREDRGGRVELHIGEKCDIEINPKDVDAKDYPTIRKFATKIGELTQVHRNEKVNVIGTVRKLFPATTFERQDLTPGKVMRFMLSDGTGEIPVVVWNEKVDELEKVLKIGVGLQIVNAKVKKAAGEGLEIHVGGLTFVEALKPEQEFLRLADLKEGLNRVNVEGQVASKPMLRDVRTSRQELLKLATFELKDETGTMWVSAWRKHAETAANLKLGDKIIIKNAYARKGFGDQLEISTRDATSITVIH